MEGEEHCRLYISTDKIEFGTSTLLPGKKGDIDSGHEKGEEIFYVVEGQILCHFPEKEIYKELERGDIITVPPGEPHQLINTSEKRAIVSWSLAPPDK